MRIAVFILYLFSFLLKGNHYVLEPKVQHKSACAQSVEKSQRAKFEAGQLNIFDENASLDEEEHLSGDDSGDSANGSQAHTGLHFTLPQDWYFSVAGLYFQPARSHAAASLPVSGKSSPIYILHRVLRI